MKDIILENLKEKILELQTEILKEKIGRVFYAADGIARIFGLEDVAAEEILLFDNEIYGIALNLEEDSLGAVILGDYQKVKEGSEVKRTGRVLEIPISKSLIGRVLDPLLKPLDGKGEVFKNGEKPNFYPIETQAPAVIEREPVNTPLFTGIRAIDAMIPIGRGQRELIIGDRQTGKTQICLDTIFAQKFEKPENRPICIYVAIGQKASKVAKIVAELEKRGALEWTIFIVSTSSDLPSLIWLAPYAGAAIGEYFRDQGKDALIIFDDLTKHAWAYRQISLLLRRPPGREAYPGDIFNLHSRLLERAAKLSKEKGGGSLTALPIVETQLGDISSYIPTNIISITDGQIYLEPELFHQGVRPAINVGLSVSRVGSKAQRPAMKKVAGKLRLDLAQFRELEAFVEFGQELDKETLSRIERGKRVVEILKQKQFETSIFEEEILAIYLAVNGYLDDIPLEKVKDFEQKFFEFVRMENISIFEKLKENSDLDEKIEEELKKLILKYKELESGSPN
jgi:F-type H+-transporting ATPase subunit alpha